MLYLVPDFTCKATRLWSIVHCGSTIKSLPCPNQNVYCLRVDDNPTLLDLSLSHWGFMGLYKDSNIENGEIYSNN